MFKKEQEVNKTQESAGVFGTERTSVIGKSMKLKGNISSDEEILIEGKVEGTIKMKHNVVVGKSGKVKADISAREIIIEGEVNGNVHGLVKVEIMPGGILNGDIISEKVVLAEGAKFKGSIDMSVKSEEPEKKVKPVEEPEKKEIKS